LGQKNAYVYDYAPVVEEFGSFEYYKGNPDLLPERQRGAEGGLELYFGNRGSLVVTRYNQTVDDLITATMVDSVRSLAQFPIYGNSYDTDGYGYQYQFQNLNVANIRNQGWELQGSMRLGALTTKGTYSWTKSRTIGVAERYRSLFRADWYPQWQPGAKFDYLPEHTWALGFTYAIAKSSVTLTLNGLGNRTAGYNGSELYYAKMYPSIRLRAYNSQNVSSEMVPNLVGGYSTADVVASHRLSPMAEAVLQIFNAANRFTNDYSANYAVIGRQAKIGIRLRLQ
jgi:outer membrane cobalamin receptor